jgi:hypothetical protein
MSDWKTIELLPGETKVLEWWVNLSGRLYVRIQNESGTNSLNCWWITGPFGSVQSIGTLVGFADLELPGFGWGKLKANSADSKTTVWVTELAQVAGAWPKIPFG